MNADLTSRGRFAPPGLREQVGLRDRTCAAPYCTRPTRHLDLDHLDPWTDPDTSGPPGETDPPGSPPGKRNSQTRSDNLAALCRHHHRAKTLTGWRYEMLTPGVYLWTGPHGLRFLTFAGQTLDLSRATASCRVLASHRDQVPPWATASSVSRRSRRRRQGPVLAGS